MKLLKNRLFIGAMCLLLAGILAFFFLPRLYSAQSSTVEIVTLRQSVEFGTVINDNMLTVSEVGAYGLQDNVVRSKSEIVGLVAGAAIYAGEYLWRERFITAEAYADSETKTGYDLSEGTYLLTISLPTESAGVAGILRAGDIVDIYGYMENESGDTSVREALSAITVYEVLNSKLVALGDLDAKLESSIDADSSDYDLAPAYVVFIVNEQQAKTLIGLEKDKSLHLTLREAGA